MLESFAIVTTRAGPDSEAIHDRQPVILEKSDFARWLDLSADVSSLLVLSGWNLGRTAGLIHRPPGPAFLGQPRRGLSA